MLSIKKYYFGVHGIFFFFWPIKKNRCAVVLPIRYSVSSSIVCVKNMRSHDSLCCCHYWNVQRFMGNSLNVLSVHLLAARTRWLNITGSWQDWPEDRPLCSKLRTAPALFRREAALPVYSCGGGGCHAAECVNRRSQPRSPNGFYSGPALVLLSLGLLVIIIISPEEAKLWDQIGFFASVYLPKLSVESNIICGEAGLSQETEFWMQSYEYYL